MEVGLAQGDGRFAVDLERVDVAAFVLQDDLDAIGVRRQHIPKVRAPVDDGGQDGHQVLVGIKDRVKDLAEWGGGQFRCLLVAALGNSVEKDGLGLVIILEVPDATEDGGLGVLKDRAALVAERGIRVEVVIDQRLRERVVLPDGQERRVHGRVDDATLADRGGRIVELVDLGGDAGIRERDGLCRLEAALLRGSLVDDGGTTALTVVRVFATAGRKWPARRGGFLPVAHDRLLHATEGRLEQLGIDDPAVIASCGFDGKGLPALAVVDDGHDGDHGAVGQLQGVRRAELEVGKLEVGPRPVGTAGLHGGGHAEEVQHAQLALHVAGEGLHDLGGVVDEDGLVRGFLIAARAHEDGDGDGDGGEQQDDPHHHLEPEDLLAQLGRREFLLSQIGRRRAVDTRGGLLVGVVGTAEVGGRGIVHRAIVDLLGTLVRTIVHVIRRILVAVGWRCHGAARLGTVLVHHHHRG
mmetsp:Transcript_15649/g.43874  ORF Transcript_15649/g.43874 Transcript_15649/m.43874 type:complete len:467 (-) Transcript_15649:131-1531(-)